MSKITLVDMRSGIQLVTEWFNQESLITLWSDGNWSCDCNRAQYFGNALEAAFTTPCLSLRYLVVDVDPIPEGYKLEDFNDDYPTYAKAIAKRWMSLTQEERARVHERYNAFLDGRTIAIEGNQL